MRLHTAILCLLPILVLADPGPNIVARPEPEARPENLLGDVDPLPPRFQRGISYAHSWRGGGYGTASSARTLRELRRMNVGWVALTPFGYQERPDQTRVFTIYNRRGHETDRAMALDIAEAHRLGLRVLLKPHLWIDHNSWPGEIAFDTPERFDAWFDSYSQMILHYADFAESAGASALSIGCELKGVSGEGEARWRQLISEIRSRYGGMLTYASNWDEYENVPWWDAVDAVGINAYFPLAETANPSLDELIAGALSVRTRLDAFHARVQRPIIFTEIGFGSVAGAAARPWEAEREARPDVEIQRRCYEAVVRTFGDAPWLEGVYWWKWFSAASEQPRGFDHDHFSPRNKPAQQIIEAWYSQTGEG